MNTCLWHWADSPLWHDGGNLHSYGCAPENPLMAHVTVTGLMEYIGVSHTQPIIMKLNFNNAEIWHLRGKVFTVIYSQESTEIRILLDARPSIKKIG